MTLTCDSGRFRWAYCQLDYLGKCLPGRIWHALDELPETLDATYERTLQEINDTNWEFAQRLLLCVAVVSRPLRVEELAELLAFDFKAGSIPKYREDWRLHDPVEAVLSTCSTLLALVNVENSQVIQFSHFSVKEFLTSSRFAGKHNTLSHRYHISMTLAHTLVAQACLGILLHLDENITRDSLDEFPLAKYAAEHWFEHARVEGTLQNEVERMKELFDERKPHFSIWLWIWDPTLSPWEQKTGSGWPLPPGGTPLHYAAFCGLGGIIKVLATENPQDVNSRRFRDKSTPLHLASKKGHVEVARFLVEQGADATTQAKNGADVTARDKDGRTPLHQASYGGHVDLARFLVEQGADATAQDENGWTPLHWASSWGHMELARFLVEQGADATAQDEDGWTPLHWASSWGHMELARFLVEQGADATAQAEDGQTPLNVASE
jgi:ankyrin repeat protein